MCVVIATMRLLTAPAGRYVAPLGLAASDDISRLHTSRPSGAIHELTELFFIFIKTCAVASEKKARMVQLMSRSILGKQNLSLPEIFV
jgi:hypothetical protein